MRDIAIRNTHPTVVSINGGRAMDSDGSLVPLDEAKITTECDRLRTVHAATQHQRDRVHAYPPIGDQLDALFHAGVFPPEMAAQIQATKDKYPKKT